MKLFVSVLGVITILSINLWAQTAVPPNIGGGTEDNPYQIATLENLYWIVLDTLRWDKHYIQTADIDASETAEWFDGDGWKPIGSYFVDEVLHVPFRGSYNGQDHVISGLFINRYERSMGLFGHTHEAIISNLGLIDVDIEGRFAVGSIVGYNKNSIIRNCYSTGSVKAWINFVFQSYVGGLVGFNESSRIYNSFSNCNVRGQGGYRVGGLVGENLYSLITNCYSRGTAHGTHDVGGIAGFNSSSHIINCYSTVIVSGSTSIGGLVGATVSSSVLKSYWDMESSGQTTSQGGEGRTTDEMTYPYATNTYIDWDFENIWVADQDYEINDGYPYIREDAPVSINNELIVSPKSISISNYPNPFNPETSILYTLTEKTTIELSIYNTKGQKVRTLLRGIQEAGEHRLIWNGLDERGMEMPSGIYFYQLITGREFLTRRMILLK